MVRRNRAGRQHGVKPSSDKQEKVHYSEGVRLKTSEGFDPNTEQVLLVKTPELKDSG